VKKLILALALFSAGTALADSWAPKRGAKQVPIWPPHSPVLAVGIRKLDDPEMLAKKPTTNVSNPTYTVYYPKENPSGTCILVFPGGGHILLAMGLEGT